MTLIAVGHLLTLAVNLVGFLGAILLLRLLADRRWLIALVGVNVVVVTRRLFEIGADFGFLEDHALINGFAVPFVHGLCVTTATLGAFFALRRGDSSLFRLTADCERRYRSLMRTAAKIEERLASTGGAGGGG